eukprot:m.242734 g.242734  ORF g.242734 m.242734 type:complete len:122 (-) comp14094_c0_seq1:88-453(-)
MSDRAAEAALGLQLALNTLEGSPLMEYGNRVKQRLPQTRNCPVCKAKGRVTLVAKSSDGLEHCRCTHCTEPDCGACFCHVCNRPTVGCKSYRVKEHCGTGKHNWEPCRRIAPRGIHTAELL